MSTYLELYSRTSYLQLYPWRTLKMFSFYSFQWKLRSESVSSWCIPAMKKISICYQINKLGDTLLFSHSVMSDSATPWIQLLELTPTHDHWVSDASNHLVLCHRLLLLPSFFTSIRVFSNESVLCIRWPKYWSFIISPFHEYSGLISFKMDCFDLLAVQGTLKSLLQHHSLKASILWH